MELNKTDNLYEHFRKSGWLFNWKTKNFTGTYKKKTQLSSWEMPQLYGISTIRLKKNLEDKFYALFLWMAQDVKNLFYS